MYPSNRKKKVWKEEKERLLKMTLEERRKEYLRDYVPLKDIPSWKEEMKSKSQNDDESAQEVSQVKKSLSEKVSLYRGDITLLEIDAIVNAVVFQVCLTLCDLFGVFLAKVCTNRQSSGLLSGMTLMVISFFCY
ncbi:ADP-ribose glycohydrolase MACROD2 isoform 10-T10 [Sarcophilus harrisii]